MTEPLTPTTTPASSTHRLSSFPIWSLLLVVVIAGVLFFAGLGRLPLSEPDEGRNAEVAREMLVSGDWITPHFDSFAYLDKPAVFFWMVAGSFRAFGISEWAARLPSALAALATTLLAWLLARRMFGDSTAWRAGVIFAASPLALIFARIVIFDMTLTCLVSLAMFCFWLAEASKFRRPELEILMFAAMGLATITKGPVGFIVPLLSILAYAALGGRVRELRRLRWRIGSLVFLAIVLPWFVAVSMRNPGFPRYAFWDESLLRFTTGHSHRGGSIFYYIPIYLGGFLPWSLFLFIAGLARLRRWKEIRLEQHRAKVFLFAWAAVVFAFFSISHSKLPGYFLPAIIPLSVLMANVWSEAEASVERRPDWLTAGLALLIGLGLVIASLPRILTLLNLGGRLTRKLSPSVAALVWPTLFYSGLIVLAIGVMGRMMLARRRHRASPILVFALLAALVPLLAVRWRTPLRMYLESSSSRRLANTILSSPEGDLPLYGYYYFRTGLPFYLRRPVGLVTADGDELTSNYIVSRLAAQGKQAMNLTDSAARLSDAASLASSGPSAPLVLSAEGLHVLAGKTRRPFLVIVRNDRVSDAARVTGGLEPLWTEWDDSVWKVPAAVGR